LASGASKTSNNINKSLLTFYFENSIDNNDYNTKELETKISNILKTYLIELNSDDKSIPAINPNNLNTYMVSSMQLIEGGFYCKSQSTEYPSHSMVIAVSLISSNEKNLRNLNSKLTIKNSGSNMKGRILNSNNEELKFFFNIKFDFGKKRFLVEKINFNFDNNIQINFPNDYEEVMKISENENFVFYVAKKFGRNCIGDLYVANKDRNLWTLSKKNLVLSQNDYSVDISNSEFIADFSNVK